MALNEDNIIVPKNFSIRPGTVDYGKEYEVKMAALLSLRCTGHKQLRGMWIAMNVDECGAFDDIVLYIKTKDGKNITYLIQLKHRMEPSDIGAREFKAKKGDFLLGKYYETIVQIKNATNNKELVGSEIIEHLRRNHDTTVFLLFTNRGTTENDYLKSVNKKSVMDTTWLLYQVADTQGNVFLFDYDKLDFKFEEDARSFMERLFLFTKQMHITKLDAALESAIENLLKPLKLPKSILNELVQKYVLFVTDWSKGELGGFYPLSNSHVFRVLLECLLTPYMSKLESPRDDAVCYNMWNTIMDEKVVTVVEENDCVTGFLNGYINKAVQDYCEDPENKNLWKRHPDLISKQILRTTGRAKEIRSWDAYECLWKNKKMPLLLTVNNSEDFSKLLQLLGSFLEVFRVVLLVKCPIVLLNTKISKLFSTLKDLNKDHRLEILQHPVQVQGRSSLNLLDFITDDLLHLIAGRDLIHILSNKFNVGNKFVSLPEIFVERSLERVWLKPKVLKEVADDVFVIKCNPGCDFKVFLVKYKLYFDDCQIRQWNDIVRNPDLVNVKIIQIFDEIVLEQIKSYGIIKRKTIHYLILHSDDSVQWIKSFGSIKNIVEFRKKSVFNNLEFETTDCLLKEFLNKTVLISACPGMGKTILLDYIALHTSTDMWVLQINLYQYTDYYKSASFDNSHAEPSKHLEYFANKILVDQECNNDLSQIVFRKYLDSKRVLVLLDGFDEIPMSCQKKASEMIKKIHETGFSVCVTTRPILKNHLEELLNTFAVTINPFTRNERITFLTKYFINACGGSDENTENVQGFVEKLLNAAKENLSDQDEEFTGVPLQNMLLAEAFTEDCKEFIKTGRFDNIHFDLLYLYKRFVDQKVKIVCNKFGNSSEDMLHHYKTYRSLYALRLIFPEQDLKELKVEELLKQVILFFPDTLQQLQKDGIVVVENQSTVTFVHRTFAEYLVAEWLALNIHNENRDTVQILLKRIFDPNFTTVRNIFDRILAKDCPLHLAVINRQVDSFKEIIISNTDALMKTDMGNRSYLHLIAAWGVHHPFSIKSNTEIKSLYKTIAKDSMINILKLIPTSKLKSSKDDLLNCTQLDYAILSGSLNVADTMCARLEDLNECITLKDININYSFYFKHFPYGSLGSILIKHSVVAELNKDIENRKIVNSIQEDKLHNAVITGNIQQISLLLSTGKEVNTNDVTGFTPLHLAAMFGDALVTELLLLNEADVNIKDNSGKTPLHWATVTGKLNTVTVLLSNRIDVNAIDNNGMSALHYTIVANIDHQRDILYSLLKEEANITLQDNYGKTPLHYALHYNQTEILKLLLNFGANIHIDNENLEISQDDDSLSNVLSSRDSDGGTVLHWAADKGFAEIVSLLLSYGACVEIGDNDGKTALHWAAEKGHVDVVTLLLSHGANVNAKDISSRTPLFVAVDYSNSEIVKLLLSKGAKMQEKDDLGRTPLLQAITKDCEDMTMILLSNEESMKERDNEDMNALHWAAWNGNTDVINLLLFKGATLEDKNKDGRNALIFAAANGHTAAVRFLLLQGANLKAKDNSKMNALHWASWYGHSDTVEFLLSTDTNLDVVDDLKRTALICACHNGHTAVATLLLSKGANMESMDSNNVNALNWAAHNGHIDTLNLLVTKGTEKLDTKSNHGRTALINAACNGHTAIVATLISKSANIEEKDNEGMNALLCAACKGHTDVVDLLLANGANLEAKSNYEKTALIYAADYGHVATVALILSKGANVEAKDNENMNALIWASHNCRTLVLNLLLAKRVNLEVKNRHGRTALICAAQNGHTAVVDSLLLKGADVEAKDNEGMNAFTWAVYNGYVDMVNLLIAKGVSLDSKDEGGRGFLIHAAYNGHTFLVNLLLSKGANVDETDEENMTALHWASWKGHTETIDLLLSEGANLETKDMHGRSALMYAATSDQIYAVAVLLANGADVEVADNNDRTALHFSTLKGSRDITEVLLGIGANPEVKDDEGKTPLMCAASKGHTSTVALLLSRGVKIDIQDVNGYTALGWAKRNGYESTAILLSRQANVIILD